MGSSDKLTPKQIKFIEAYSGNATDAARKAGYKGSDDTLAQVGRENLSKPQIARAIKQRNAKELKPIIADRQARQKFWTDTMTNKKTHMSLRLKASELLGKSEADFTEKLQHTGNDGGPIVVLTMPGNGSEAKTDEPKES